jgi:hypothetical protein
MVKEAVREREAKALSAGDATSLVTVLGSALVTSKSDPI